MNYNWTNNAYWLLRLWLKPGAWAEVRSVSRRLPVEPPAAGRLLAEQAIKRADWWA